MGETPSECLQRIHSLAQAKVSLPSLAHRVELRPLIWTQQTRTQRPSETQSWTRHAKTSPKAAFSAWPGDVPRPMGVSVGQEVILEQLRGRASAAEQGYRHRRQHGFPGHTTGHQLCPVRRALRGPCCVCHHPLCLLSTGAGVWVLGLDVGGCYTHSETFAARMGAVCVTHLVSHLPDVLDVLLVGVLQTFPVMEGPGQSVPWNHRHPVHECRCPASTRHYHF